MAADFQAVFTTFCAGRDVVDFFHVGADLHRGFRSHYERRWKKMNMMLKWPDILQFAKEGNPAPDRKVVKTDEQWREQLSAEEYRVTRQAGTERAFSSEMCGLFEPGIYDCLCCGAVLFDANLFCPHPRGVFRKAAQNRLPCAGLLDELAIFPVERF